MAIIVNGVSSIRSQPVQSSIVGPLSRIPQGKHLPEVESKGFVKETILGRPQDHNHFRKSK